MALVPSTTGCRVDDPTPKPQTTHNSPPSASDKPYPTDLRASTVVCSDLGISDVTMWRWEKRGLLKLVNIAGRKYVDLKSLAEFQDRARRGEFAQGPAGAARHASQERTAQNAGKSRKEISTR